MKTVALIHHKLSNYSKLGGSESVLFHSIDALQWKYNLILIADGSSGILENLETINDMFGTCIDNDSFKPVELSKESWDFRPFGLKSYSIRHTLFNAVVLKKLPPADLYISTINELYIPKLNIQYVHYPINKNLIACKSLKDLLVFIANKLLHFYYNIDTKIQPNKLLTNSQWTASIIKNKKQWMADVLYPPCKNPLTLYTQERELNIVMVSRISREKNISKVIKNLYRWLIKNHYTLKIIGPISDKNYFEEMKNLYDSAHVKFLGKVTHHEMSAILSSSKFFVHGMIDEHFGITVAEALLHGCIPVVHNSGGQAEIFDYPDSKYTEHSELPSIMENLDSNYEYVFKYLQLSYNNYIELFSIDSYKNNFGSMVDELLQN